MLRKCFVVLFVTVASVAASEYTCAGLNEVDNAIAARLFGGAYDHIAEKTLDPNWTWCTPSCNDGDRSPYKTGTKQYGAGKSISCRQGVATCGTHREEWFDCVFP